MTSPAVVLDTNVLVAAGFNRRSASAKIVDAVAKGELRMVWNTATRREIERIIQQIPPLRGHAVAHLFRARDRFSNRTRPERFPGIPDPDDRTFAALAHSADAILVSNDTHLLHHCEKMDATVLTPDAFWGTLHRRSSAAEGTAYTDKSAADDSPTDALDDGPRRLF
jgi:predicted nucleic acid-binding protein